MGNVINKIIAGIVMLIIAALFIGYLALPVMAFLLVMSTLFKGLRDPQIIVLGGIGTVMSALGGAIAGFFIDLIFGTLPIFAIIGAALAAIHFLNHTCGDSRGGPIR